MELVYRIYGRWFFKSTKISVHHWIDRFDVYSFFPEWKGQSIVRRRMAYTILLVYILLSVLILGVVSCERGLRLEGCYSLVEDFRLDDTIQLFSLGERIYLERFEQLFSSNEPRQMEEKQKGYGT